MHDINYIPLVVGKGPKLCRMMCPLLFQLFDDVYIQHNGEILAASSEVGYL